MRRGSKLRSGAAALAAALTGIGVAGGAGTASAATCAGQVYLTIDTGHMEPAETMAATLNKHNVKATFFLANEKTRRGDTSLDPSWTDFWKARAAEGHAFGSHTWRHWYVRGDVGADKVSYVPWGKPRGESLDQSQFCAELKQSENAFRAMTGRGFDGLWRAPGGKLSRNAVRFAEQCGYRHVDWSPAGFSGDELPSDRHPSRALIARQLKDIKEGDILLWHLGIWSRQDPLYPYLDELIVGLKAKGLCFARITEHPKWNKR
jgi:peptidoglycan/xylan/chitin deacetylase (PgdA/CDA1 family)